MTRMFVRVAVAAVLAISLSAGANATNVCDGVTGFTDYCPYGYTPLTGTSVPATALSVKNCCVRDTTLKSFPACDDASSGSTGAVQVVDAEDGSWLVQDGQGFTRSLGRYKAMCFNILVNDNLCNTADACCTTKRPAYMQFKLAADSLTAAPRCKFSYGTAVATLNGLKRIKWTSPTDDATTRFVNVPLVWKKNAKATTMCIYSDYSVGDTCEFETVCGLSGDSPAVPDASGNYDDGCEMRIVGRAKAGSAACCTPTFSVDAFDSNTENRVAGAEVTQIELRGV